MGAIPLSLDESELLQLEASVTTIRNAIGSLG
jgi:hypothetical protein